MTLERIYTLYDRQSDGFARAVEIHCGFGLSRDEILRISERASTADRFIDIWVDEHWWQDGDEQ